MHKPSSRQLNPCKKEVYSRITSGLSAAIDQTFSRLALENKLLRLDRSADALPIQGLFGMLPPSTVSMVAAIESTSGAAEANVLGLTT